MCALEFGDALGLRQATARPMTSPRAAGREFKRLGAENVAVSSATTASYFVTAPDGGARRQAAGREGTATEVHAKAMGTAFTACGLNALSWVKYWDEPFYPKVQNACQTCVVRTRPARHRG